MMKFLCLRAIQVYLIVISLFFLGVPLDTLARPTTPGLEFVDRFGGATLAVAVSGNRAYIGDG